MTFVKYKRNSPGSIIIHDQIQAAKVHCSAKTENNTENATIILTISQEILLYRADINKRPL